MRGEDKPRLRRGFYVPKWLSGAALSLLVLLAAAGLAYLNYRLFFPGAAFIFFSLLLLILVVSSGITIMLKRKRKRGWVIALALGVALAAPVLLGGGLRLGQAFYWVNRNPDRYRGYEITAGTVDGSVSISPAVVERGGFQTFTLTFRAGEEGVAEGGGLILRLGKIIPVGGKPHYYDCNYQDMWAEALQVNRPSGGGYVSAIVPGGIIASLGKPPAPAHRNFLLNTFVLDAARHRQDPEAPIYYSLNAARRHEVHLKLVRGSLRPGQELVLVLGDISGGGPGWRMPAGAADTDLVVYVDPDGSGLYRMVSSYATLEVGGKDAASLELAAPSTPALGEDFDFVVRALDGEGYLALLHEGAISLLSQPGLSFAVDNYCFSPEDRGAVRLPARITAPGTYRIAVRDERTGRIYTGNPVVVDPQTKDRLYWGDLHQHTTLGKDANRTPQYVFEHNRRVDRFDFASISIHDLFDYWSIPPTAAERRCLLDTSEAWNRPGEFVTFHGYEWTDLYQGHRNIYFAPGSEPFLVDQKTADTPRELQRRLGDSRYLVIPHHSAWRLLHASVPYNWGSPDWVNMRLVEVYSKHGSSDRFDGPYPIHHDATPFYVRLFGESSHRAYAGLGSYVREALAAGYRFGFIAGSDNHWARGGTSFGSGVTRDFPSGLQAVYAPELTREALFEAMWNRHTYGTTGARIIVDFRVDGFPMGSEISSSAGIVYVTFTVKGTAPLQAAELWKYSASRGYELFQTDGGGRMELEAGYEDRDFVEDSFYFLHAIQSDGHLAWAGPVWVDHN